MAIQLYTPRKGRPSRIDLIEKRIEFGQGVLNLVVEVYKDCQDLRRRKCNDAVEGVIRDIGQLMGMGGQFKNGCLYREKKLLEEYKKGQPKQICEHAIPVAELRKRYLDNCELNFVKLSLCPIVRISEDANRKLDEAKRTKSGYQKGLPLSRYEGLGIELVTHNGEDIDPATWKDEDHWNLIKDTVANAPELAEIIKHFKIFEGVG